MHLRSGSHQNHQINIENFQLNSEGNKKVQYLTKFEMGLTAIVEMTLYLKKSQGIRSVVRRIGAGLRVTLKRERERKSEP